MTFNSDIEKTEAEIKVLQKKLELLKEIEVHKSYRSQKLWFIMRDELGFSIDMCDEIVDAVEEWLPKEHDTNSYKWNECLKLMQEKLR